MIDEFIRLHSMLNGPINKSWFEVKRYIRSCENSPIDKSWPLLDRVEFTLRDAGLDYDDALDIAILARDMDAVRTKSKTINP